MERDMKLKQSFKTVFPICAGCSRDGSVNAVNYSWNISGERVLRHIVSFKDLVVLIKPILFHVIYIQQ